MPGGSRVQVTQWRLRESSRTVLLRHDIMDGVPVVLEEVQVEATSSPLEVLPRVLAAQVAG